MQAQVHERVIHQLLKRQAQALGGREFLRFGDLSLSLGELDASSDRVATGLQDLGVVKGDKVGILMGNRPEFISLWLGLCKLGAVEVPLNTAHRGELLAYMLSQAECRYLAVEGTFLDRVAPVVEHLPLLETVLVLDPPPDPPRLDRPLLDLEALCQNSGCYDEVEVRYGDPFAIIYTSGTSGPSKGALMPHNYALYMGEIISRSAGYTTRDRLYNALPLFHGNAQFLSFMAALVSGASTVLAERFSAGQFWNEVRRHGCTEFNYIGAILPILLKADPSPDDADNPLRVMVGAGAARDIMEAFEARFQVKLIEGYGMSEIGVPLMNTQENRKPGSCGRPWRDYQVKVVDDQGLEVKPGQPGELYIRPLRPYCMQLEYHRMPDKTVEAWRDLWFHTGDYLLQDEDGYFFFLDRKKDALRRRGENISSYEVERVINSHPRVLESAVVAVKSDLGEDEVLACVVLKPQAELTAEELLDHCQEGMAYFMVPRYLRFMATLPKTLTEKVQKAQLRQDGLTPEVWDRESAGYQLRR